MTKDKVSIKEYVDKQFEDLYTLLATGDKASDNEKQLIREQLKTTADSLSKRLDDMNNFRHQLDQERGNYETRHDAELRVGPVIERMTKIEAKQANFDGRLAVIAGAASIITIMVSISVSVILHFVK